MDRSPMTVISFIVIAFNEEHRISKTLKSILNQVSKYDFEIIVINDGSTDETYKVAYTCLKKFGNYKIIDEKINIGRGSARQLGASLAAGEYLAFIDSDIELPHNWLQNAMDAISNGADAVSGIAVPDGDCVVIGRISRLEPRRRPGSAKLTGNNLLIRKKVLDAVPFRKIPYGDDIRLAWDLERQGFTIERLDELAVHHSESKSYRNTLLWQFQQGKDATQLLFEYRKLRLPDLVWIVSIMIPISSNYFKTSYNLIALFFVESIFYVFAVSIAFIGSRFKIHLAGTKAVLAVIVNVPLMTSYIAGRFAGALFSFKKFTS